MQHEVIRYLRRRDNATLKELLNTNITEEDFLSLVGPINIINAGELDDFDTKLGQVEMIICKEWSTCIDKLDLRYFKMMYELELNKHTHCEGLEACYYYIMYRKSTRMYYQNEKKADTLDEWFDFLHKYYLVVRDNPQYLGQRKSYLLFYTPEEFEKQLEDIIGTKLTELGYLKRLKILNKLKKINLDKVTHNKIKSLIQAKK